MTAPSITVDRAAPAGVLVAAPLYRRVLAALYEGVLLFGVLVATGTVYAVSMHQTSGIEKRPGLLAACFVVLGLYFVLLWSRGGQTLADKTWHLRIVTDTGAPLGPWRALARYLAAWAWFLPPLAIAKAIGVPSLVLDLGLPLAWFIAYPLTSRFHPSRQFPHDLLCRTAIVSTR